MQKLVRQQLFAFESVHVSCELESSSTSASYARKQVPIITEIVVHTKLCSVLQLWIYATKTLCLSQLKQNTRV